MKKLLYILPFIAAFFSCSDNPYSGYDPDLEETDQYLHTPNAILIAVGDPSYTNLTRGSGAFDSRRDDQHGREMWDSARVYIYSFPKDAPNLSATWASDSTACLVDATAKNSALTSDKHGKMASLSFTDGNFISWTDGTTLYYNANQPKRRYDFFGYFYDDAIADEAAIVRNSSQIEIPLEIDGSQDVMGGYADIDELQAENIKKNPKRDSIYAYYYSNYTGNSSNNVFPIVNFRHYLTRLKFRIYPNDSISQYVFVDSISVVSPYKGNLVVAASDKKKLGYFMNMAQQKELFLHDYDRKPIKPDSFNISLLAGEENLPFYDRTSRQVGESLLLPPETSYTISLYMHQTWPKEIFYKISYEITNKGYIFKPGYEYTLRILLAGNHPV
ncbi:MAG: fimbrillin family protein, partial [Bacteroidaceae bacterium]|nr:fimbrillin family protein [Bacteroidaceae bacterium]